MKRHVSIYLDHFGYTIADWIPCEIPDCGQRAVDIHHIHARGMGGSDERDRIENLMALCREHHDAYGDRSQFIDDLQAIHNERMEARGY